MLTNPPNNNSSICLHWISNVLWQHYPFLSIQQWINVHSTGSLHSTMTSQQDFQTTLPGRFIMRKNIKLNREIWCNLYDSYLVDFVIYLVSHATWVSKVWVTSHQVAYWLKYWTADCKVQGSSHTCIRDLFLFWVHSALPQKLSRRFTFVSFGGDFKPSVLGNPLKLA